MPIQSRDDAVEIEERISRVFAASPEQRVAEVRGLFAEVLDFNAAYGQVSLAGATGNVHLPAAARIAELDGVHVLFVALPASNTDRVRKVEVDSVAKLLAEQLGDDLLLVFTNPSATQLHIILPSFTGARPSLRRMVVDRDLPRRTAVQQVSNIYWKYQASGSIRTALDRAFDVEPVTREFFGEYKRIFESAEQSVNGFSNTDGGKENRRSFVQTLFNRLMFVYFLSRKGWLTFNGDADYLNALWHDYQANSDQANFYDERLRHLFFFGLNNPQSKDLNFKDSFMESVFGTVPFLNGGLFEPNDLDNQEHITVPDAAIEQVLSGLFDRFNFTVMESTPFDIEVAVDPEMLGKVFEELVTGRHDSGAYYTPRPVVSFMCREALKGYLVGQETGLSPEVIARFVDGQDTKGIGVAQARRVANALAQVTVMDPACGSGAYLLGMMQELIELQTALYNAGADAKALYDLKLEIIQRNLYGVDIDEFAVNIAMLRMWLSLAIDYEGATPEPLPNLDFKVVCGDSLLGADPSADVEVQGTLGQDKEQFLRLGQLKADFMRASLGPDKERLRTAIQERASEIRSAMGLSTMAGGVDWRVEFAEVFANYGGFDVVIGNPPYVEARSSSISEAIKDAYQSQVRSDWGETLPRGSDLLLYFYPRSVELLKRTGYGCFITQNAWLNTDYGQKFQQFSIGRFSFLKIIDSSTGFFTNVTSQNINAVISVFTKGEETHIECGIADSDMTVTSRGTIAARSPIKWGHLMEMPQLMLTILSRISTWSENVKPISFGQGLNFPKRELNQRGANIDVIVKDARFVALSADGKIKSVSKSRQGRIPALIMPRGVGSRYYCTFNTCRAFSYSAVELYLPDELWETGQHYCLWAYLNSSFVWLFRELTGRKNLGGGMLKAEATDMKTLPIDFDFDFANDAKQVFDAIKYREPLPVVEEVYTNEHLLIDDMVADYLEFSDQQEEIRQCLIERVSFRHTRARQRG